MASAVPMIVGKEEVIKLLNTQDLLINLESAFGRLSDGKDGGVEQPMRSVVSIEKHHGYLATMPGYSAMDNALATKLVSFYPNNISLPTHQAWVLLFDPSNGSLQAIIDGVSITAIRTGVASAVATKHLASPNAKILAIIGSGVQARSHFEALSHVQHFEEVRIWSRNPDSVKRFADDISENAEAAGTILKICATAKEAVEDADVICTVTFATTPVIHKDWIKPGAHINAVGACRPDWQELDSNLMRSAVVYCDSREACLRESGDVILSECEVYADIGEVINGRKQALWEQTTVFKSVGLAIEDVISAKLVYDKIMQKQAEIPSSIFSPSATANVTPGTTPFFSTSAGSSVGLIFP